VQRQAMTRRTLVFAAFAPSAAAASATLPSWPECGRKPRCNFVQIARSQDVTRCVPPPRDSQGRVLS